MISVPLTGIANFDHLVKVVTTRFLYCEAIIFSLYN